MSDIISWINSTAYPALSACWSFFISCFDDIVSIITKSRLVFIFALFLVGTIISTIVYIVTSAPDVSDVSTSYPDFRYIKQRDLYFSGFNRPINGLSKLHFKHKADKQFESTNLPYVTIGGYKFYNPDYKSKKSYGYYKRVEHDYFKTSKSSESSDSSLDIEVDE